MSEPTPADLQAQRAKKKTASRSLLPSPPPPAGAGPDVLAQWLTAALGLGRDPVTSATRYGRSEDSRLVLNLRSGERIAFARQADAFSADQLARRVILQTGAVVPPYQRSDAHHLATAMVCLADIAADDDDRDEARDWGTQFLHRAQPVGAFDLSTPTGRYAGLCTLRDHRPRDPLRDDPDSVAEQSPVLTDEATGARLVRCLDFTRYVRRAVVRPLPERTLYSRMIEVGWDHAGQLQQRQPQGTNTAKVRALIAPAGWEDA